jgi:hypothetical protein
LYLLTVDFIISLTNRTPWITVAKLYVILIGCCHDLDLNLPAGLRKKILYFKLNWKWPVTVSNQTLDLENFENNEINYNNLKETIMMTDNSGKICSLFWFRNLILVNSPTPTKCEENPLFVFHLDQSIKIYFTKLDRSYWFRKYKWRIVCPW